MNLSELLSAGMIERIPIHPENAQTIFHLAKRDIQAAEDNLKLGNLDWTLVIAYNAMLQAARSLMFLKGFRPKGEYKHLAVVKFIEALGGTLSPGMVIAFNRMRIKRHQAVYDEPERISKTEAENAIRFAKQFVETIRKNFD